MDPVEEWWFGGKRPREGKERFLIVMYTDVNESRYVYETTLSLDAPVTKPGTKTPIRRLPFEVSVKVFIVSKGGKLSYSYQIQKPGGWNTRPSNEFGAAIEIEVDGLPPVYVAIYSPNEVDEDISALDNVIVTENDFEDAREAYAKTIPSPSPSPSPSSLASPSSSFSPSSPDRESRTPDLVPFPK